MASRRRSYPAKRLGASVYRPAFWFDRSQLRRHPPPTSVAATSVSVALLTAAAALDAATVNVQLAMATMTATAALDANTANLRANQALMTADAQLDAVAQVTNGFPQAVLAATAAMDVPTLNLQATPPLLTAAAALLAADERTGVDAAALTASALLYAPGWANALVQALLTADAALLAPSAQIYTPVLALMTADGAVLAVPSWNLGAAAAAMSASAAMDAAGYSNELVAALLTADAVLLVATPTVLTPTAATLAATAAMLAPTWRLQGTPAVMTATVALLIPSIGIRPSTAALLTATALIFAPANVLQSGPTAALMRASAAVLVAQWRLQATPPVMTASAALLVITIRLPSSTLPASIRVDVYAAGASPARLGNGPITQVLDFEYGNAVDRIGDAKLVLAATDSKVLDITDLGQLRIYRGGEGRVFVGRVREIATGQDASGQATTEVTLDDLAVDLTVASTGLGLTLTDVSAAGMLSALLAAANTTAPTSFASGSVDSSSITLRKRHDADAIWPAIVSDAPVWSMHARHDSVTDPTAPVVDLGAFGADSGLQFGIGAYPLQEIRKQRAGGGIVNRVIGFGQGEGYPALSLKAASHGANLYPVTTTDVTATLCSKALAHPVTPHSGTDFFVFTETGGVGAYQIDQTQTISGATTGRTWKVNLWVRGVGANVGKAVSISLLGSGGGGGTETDSQSITLTAAWQRVALSLTMVSNDKTTLTLRWNRSASVTAGEILYVDQEDGEFWESTTYRYPVKRSTNPDGSYRYFIRDYDSEVAYGVREDYRTVKVAYPISATKASWVGACDQVYDLCAEWLQLHTAALSTYSAKVLGLNHVSGGSQVVKVGDKSKLWFHGATADGAWLTVDALLWLMAYRRRVGAAGTNEWDLTLSSVDLHYMDAFARLAGLMQEYKGSGTDMKQYNFVTTFTTANQAPFNNVGFVVVELKLKDMWVNKATLTVQQVAGSGAANTEIYVYAGGGLSMVVATGLNAQTSHDYDITAALVQAPTPVPYSETAFVSGLSYVTPLVQVQNVDATKTGISYSVSVRVEATKIPLQPS